MELLLLYLLVGFVCSIILFFSIHNWKLERITLGDVSICALLTVLAPVPAIITLCLVFDLISSKNWFRVVIWERKPVNANQDEIS